MHPDVTSVLVAEHQREARADAARARLGAAATGPGPLRRSVGRLLVTTGHRMAGDRQPASSRRVSSHPA